MSLYQFAACVDGWNRSQGGETTEAPSIEEFEAAKRAHGDA
ncbi:MAG: hypothetical protein AB7L41_06200 [Flavobacteriaceae bacterium]